MEEPCLSAFPLDFLRELFWLRRLLLRGVQLGQRARELGSTLCRVMWFRRRQLMAERAGPLRVITWPVISIILDREKRARWSGIPLTVREETSFKNWTFRLLPRLESTPGPANIADTVSLK